MLFAQYRINVDIQTQQATPIQSNIFDHLLAILSEFDLKVFQNPTGNDFKKNQTIKKSL